MSKRLNQNLNSSYLEAANRLRPSKARRRVVAYVESYDDVAFWRGVLEDFETPELYFEVMLPGRDNLQKGKHQALTNVLSASQLGGAMIACVDADYDYLMQDTNPGTTAFNASPFVVHTYVYAIENYQCYAPSLHQAVVMATLNDRPTIDFEAFLREYSQIIWPLFVWNLRGYFHDDYKSFTMLDFCSLISFRDINPFHPEQSLTFLRRRVNQKMAWMQQHYPNAKKSYLSTKQRLRELGVTPETTYLYIQGHTLFESVVLPLLEPVCAMLRKEREREIKRLAVHNQQRQCELSAYQHAVLPVETILKKNQDFKDAPPFQLVKDAILHIIEYSKSFNTQQNETDNSESTENAAPPAAGDGVSLQRSSSDSV
ncbi:MAG: DUF4435 domain-containing protein [Bacteroidaceae bacterium]|nr:DUF4435 domain-containing protein [Bacteroidaceae bacterium]